MLKQVLLRSNIISATLESKSIGLVPALLTLNDGQRAIEEMCAGTVYMWALLCDRLSGRTPATDTIYRSRQ